MAKRKILDYDGLQTYDSTIKEYIEAKTANLDNAVLTTAQELTDEQKAQARANIEVKPTDLVAKITNEYVSGTGIVYSCDTPFVDLWVAYEAGRDVFLNIVDMIFVKADFVITASQSDSEIKQVRASLINGANHQLYIVKEDDTVSFTTYSYITKSDMKQETGSSKVLPMSQKAVTDALALKADQTALDEAIDAIPQPDWNQNDSTAADYVKNRTHWEETVETPIVEETTFELVDGMGQLTAAQPLEVGQEYVVNLDGVQYNAMCKEIDLDGEILSYLGNLVAPFPDSGIDTGEPFFIAPMDSNIELGIMVNSDVTEHTVSIIGNIVEINHLNPKYIKDMYYEYIAPNTDLVLDTYLNAEGDNWWFYSDYFYLESFLVEGATYIVTCNDETYTCTARCDNYGDVYIGNQAIVEDDWDEGTFPEIIESNEPFFLYTFEEEFDYGLCMQTAGEYSIVIQGIGEKLTPHKIDMKYMPDSITYGMRNLQNNINNIYNSNEFMKSYNPTGTGSFSMNRKAGTTIGSYSHTDGWNAMASGDWSHAEGYETTASGDGSHAEGYKTTASGDWSHAEGYKTTASGDWSHAEGSGSIITLSLTGGANSTSYKVSSNNSNIKIGRVLNYNDTYVKITDYDSSTLTITTDKTLSSTALSNTIVDLVLGIASGKYSHAEGNNTTASNTGAHAEGWNTTASGIYGSHAEGYFTTASGTNSHAEGSYTTASGHDSHAEGSDTTASGIHSHAEGGYTKASNDSAHAEGSNTEASGMYSHAEGLHSQASGQGAHAEGYRTIASGTYSHAEGYYTIASGRYQHVQGKFNIDDVDIDGKPLNTYAHIVGNGTSDSARSNAHTLDWDGNAWFQGNIYVGGTGQDDENAKKLATEESVTAISTLVGDKSVATQISEAMANAGGGVDADTELITIADIDEICGATV